MPDLPFAWDRRRPCEAPGCRALAAPRASVCRIHEKARLRALDARRAPAHLRGYDSEWRRVRQAFIAEHPYCEVCGTPSEEVDHVVPLIEGGSHDTANLVALCRGHHVSKTLKHRARRKSR